MATIELPSDVNETNVKKFVKDVVWPAFEAEREKLGRIQEWAAGNQPEYLVPPRTSREKRALLKLAKTPWCGLVVDTFTQALYVDGYRTQGAVGNVPGPWQTWNANNMHARQMAIHRAAVTYGYAYARALPGTAWDGAGQAVLRGLSPLRCFALYDDPVADDYPRYALEWLQDGQTVRFYNATHYFDIPMPERGSFPDEGRVVSTWHGIGVVPIVRYLDCMDLDGRTRGEVERLIPVASRLDKTLFDRLLVQHFNSWRVRWATGLDSAESADDPKDFLAELSQSDTLVATSHEARFGTLDPTPMGDFIAAFENDLAALESTAQLPPNWSGGVSNVGPEALSLMRANTTHKLLGFQVSFGSSHNQLLRLAAHIEGDTSAATDFHAAVTWADMDVRSLGQLIDAWGKAHAILGVPAQALWRKITSQEEAEQWVSEFESTDKTALELKYWGIKQPVPEGEGSNAPQPNQE
ncbi:phage portal protein [Mycobacteroides chelonae]|nr:phage portal protein [Mycobacteroides chelonae]